MKKKIKKLFKKNAQYRKLNGLYTVTNKDFIIHLDILFESKEKKKGH